MTTVSIPKSKGNPGAPLPKDPNIIFIRTRDIKTFPTITDGEAVMAEAIVLNTDAKAVAVYCTPDTISIKDSTEGGSDERGFVHELEASHPGKEEAFKAFVKESINEDFVVLVIDEKGTQVLGSLFNPMKMDIESQDDKDAIKTKIKLKAAMRSRNPIVYYEGPAVAIAPVGVNEEGA